MKSSHPQQFDRLLPLLGEQGLNKLKSSTVMVFGVGGVGSFAVEALARSGIGHLVIIDKDVVEPSNINRQLMALHSTIGKSKVDLLKARIHDINPGCKVTAHHRFYTEETHDIIFNQPVDFVFDAIDTVTYKLMLIRHCLKNTIPIITSCGMGNRMDPSQVVVTELEKTTYDPIAKVLRLKLRKENNAKKLPCVFSKEIPFKVKNQCHPFSNALVPSSAGLTAAAYIIRRLIEDEK